MSAILLSLTLGAESARACAYRDSTMNVSMATEAPC
jgi:hypothetical protein